MEEIDKLIVILQRVKNCSKALDKLENIRENLLFKDRIFEDGRQKWVDHIKECLDESIRLIKVDMHDCQTPHCEIGHRDNG